MPSMARNKERIRNASALKMKGNIGDLIHLVSFRDGLESEEDRNKSGKISETFLRLMPGKEEEITERINASDSDKIGFILADQTIGRASELAEKKGIERAAFCSDAAAMLVQRFSIPKLIEDGIIDNEGQFFLSPISVCPAMMFYPVLLSGTLNGTFWFREGDECRDS